MTLNPINSVGIFLDKQYQRMLEDCSAHTRSQILYTIIQIKMENAGSHSSYNQTLYLDGKQFIDSSISSLNAQAFGYDTFNLENVFAIYDHMAVTEAISLNNYLLRQLKVSGYEEDLEKVKNQASDLNLQFYKQNTTLIYFLRYLIYLCSRNIWSMMIALAFILSFYVIILLPVCSPRIPALFRIEYDQYSDIFFLNHVCNLTAGAFDLGNNFSIVALGPVGLLCLVLGKILFIVIIANFFVQRILEKLAN